MPAQECTRTDNASRIALVALSRRVDWRDLLTIVRPETPQRAFRQISASNRVVGSVVGGEGGIRIYPGSQIPNHFNESAPTEAMETTEFLNGRT